MPVDPLGVAKRIDNYRPKDTNMRQIAAKRSRDMKFSCRWDRILRLRSVKRIRSGWNSSTFRSDKISLSDLSQQQCGRGDLSLPQSDLSSRCVA